MGVQRRRRAAAAEARAKGEVVTSRADIETEYLERADAPLQQQEFTTKAFNVMWIDFFKLFAALATAASLYVALKSFRQGEKELFGFHVVSLFMYFAGRQWLATADVLMHDTRGLFGPFSKEFNVFLVFVFIQLSILPLLHLTGHPPTKWHKCFPSGLVFLLVGLAVVAYMRWSLGKTLKYRAELSKKLFG